MSDKDKIKEFRVAMFEYKAIEATHTAVDNAKRVLNSALHGPDSNVASESTIEKMKKIRKELDDLHFNMYDEIHDIRSRADTLYNELTEEDE